MGRRLLALSLAVATLLALLPAAALPARAADSFSATGVMGQGGDFTTDGAGVSDTRYRGATATALDAKRHRLFMSDNIGHRILVFNLNADNTLPDDKADQVIGQVNYSDQSPGTSSTQLNQPSGLAYDERSERLYVADYSNRRVVVFPTSNIVPGLAATLVLGQPDFTTSSAAHTQSGIDSPRSVALNGDGSLLFVADEYNQRVMVWATSSSSGANASHMIGQSDFLISTYVATQRSTYRPCSVAVDPTTSRLFVMDARYRRVLVFPLDSLQTNMLASQVIGQPDFGSAMNTISQRNFSGYGGDALGGIAAGSGRLFVASAVDNRVLVFDTTRTANYPEAVAQLGQNDYFSNTPNSGGRSGSSLSNPANVTADTQANKLLVFDRANRRVLIFDAGLATSSVAVAVDPSISLSISGRSTACNGEARTGTATGSSVSLGRIAAGTRASAGQDILVASNAASGWKLLVRTAAPLSDGRGNSIPHVTAGGPAAFPALGTPAFAYTFDWMSPNTWYQPANYASEVFNAGGTGSAIPRCVAYQVQAASSTPAGSYSTTVTWTLVPRF